RGDRPDLLELGRALVPRRRDPTARLSSRPRADPLPVRPARLPPDRRRLGRRRPELALRRGRPPRLVAAPGPRRGRAVQPPPGPRFPGGGAVAIVRVARLVPPVLIPVRGTSPVNHAPRGPAVGTDGPPASARRRRPPGPRR